MLTIVPNVIMVIILKMGNVNKSAPFAEHTINQMEIVKLVMKVMG